MSCFIFGGGGGGKGDSGLDFSQVNMEPQYALAGKKFYNQNKELKTGTILNWDGTPLTLADGETISGADIIEPSLSRRYIPSGKYLGKPVELAPMPQGAVEISPTVGQNYTIPITKTAGYINAGSEEIDVTDYFELYRLSTSNILFPSKYNVTLPINGKIGNGDITVRKVNIYHTTVRPTDRGFMNIDYDDIYYSGWPGPLFFSLIAKGSETYNTVGAMHGDCSVDGTFSFAGRCADGEETTYRATIENQPGQDRLHIELLDGEHFYPWTTSGPIYVTFDVFLIG